MTDAATITEPKIDERVALAPPWRVVIHNDYVTPMEFVIAILVGVFRLEMLRAEEVMLEAHKTGAAHVVTLTLEEAEARVQKAHALARAARYPLTFTYESDA